MALFDYDVIREGGENVLRIGCESYAKVPSIEDDPVIMMKVIDILMEVRDATRIVLTQKRDYEYDYTQTMLLLEIASIYNDLIRKKDLFGYNAITFNGQYPKDANKRYNDIQSILQIIKSDPVAAYIKTKRLLREERIVLLKIVEPSDQRYQQQYIDILNYLFNVLDKSKLITIAKPYLEGYKLGNRSIYSKIFRPIIKPDFMYSKLMASYPMDAEEIDSYSVGDTEVVIFKLPNDVKTLYHITPPEFKLPEDQYEILDLARKVMAEHKPTKAEFIDPQRVREVFYNVGYDLIEELADYRKVRLSKKMITRLTNILVRYTIGFGLIEVLLKDEKIQDVSINSPLGSIPVFIVHGDYGDCVTNIIPTHAEADSWASKLRMISGRPLDEANPVLDTELVLPGARTRVSAITNPLNPTGLAFSFRRHRDKPWTLPLFIKVKMLNPVAAALISFLIDGTRTMLIAGTRSGGKTSLLASFMVEIMRRYRIITVEDTLELPVDVLRKQGYNIQQLKVASALAKAGSEVSASDGIRSTLRLGDSSLIIGEVRSKEAIALYEAMRIGAAANVVAGTIHSDSPYGVFDRVVNDIGVPPTSFKATDIIIVANPIRSADGLHRFRRVTQITEVRKFWKSDPLLEHGFTDLMKYDSKKDELVVTDDLVNGDSDILKIVASNIPDFVGKWDLLWDNIQLRAKIKKAQVDYATKLKNDELLEAPFTLKCNDMYHLIAEKVKGEVGSLDSKRIYNEWVDWLKKELKRKKMK